MEIDRRQFIAGLGAGLTATSLGCGDNRATPDAGPGRDAAGADAAPVDACTATSALSARELLAGIETIVVLCMENRSFDHYLGSLRLLEGRRDVDGLVGDETNPDRDGNPVGVHRLDDFTPSDPAHNWNACHRQWNNGANDGFVVTHAGEFQADVMGYHVREQLPMIYALADTGVVCQRWFASCLGPTWPNRFYLHAATSHGEKTNVPLPGLSPTIWDRLDDAGLIGINYFHDVAWALGGLAKDSGLLPIEQFFDDAMAGTLPPFALIDPAFVAGGANDDHPDHDITFGQALIGSVAAALAASPQWNRCLFAIVYDEHGGFFDHVPPPALAEDVEPEPEFRRLGFRVPAVVLGPHVRRGCAVNAVLEHSSIAATVCRRFDLPPLNARVAAAGDLSACIDPARLGAPLPPPRLPVVEISAARLAARQARPAASHPELTAAVAARPMRPGLDRRAEADQVVRRVLGWGERLGAVRIT